MLSPIHHLTIIHYPPGGGWTSEDIVEPTWPMVEQAIRRMDDVECAPHPWDEPDTEREVIARPVARCFRSVDRHGAFG